MTRSCKSLLLVAGMAVTASAAWPTSGVGVGVGVSAQSVNFGIYDPFSKQVADGVGNIAVTCDSGVTYSLALSSGGGTYAARSMTDGRHALSYNLYTNAARTTVWGDGTGGTATVRGACARTTTNVAVYGRIPAGQNAHLGSYSDTIVVTVRF